MLLSILSLMLYMIVVCVQEIRLSHRELLYKYSQQAGECEDQIQIFISEEAFEKRAADDWYYFYETHHDKLDKIPGTLNCFCEIEYNKQYWW